jgi:hypothetical protein
VLSEPSCEGAGDVKVIRSLNLSNNVRAICSAVP